MSIPHVMNTGYSGMAAAKAAIATTGHNIANAGTEGYSRQRVIVEASENKAVRYGQPTNGVGATVNRIERFNDQYIEKQIRNSTRDLSHFEEKDMALSQIEDIFNEMNGDGLNRLVSRFFNEFRKLSDEPENPAVRQSVAEASKSMVNDFHRLRLEVDDVRKHIDSRIEGYVREVNSVSNEIRDLNERIRVLSLGGGLPNDLFDKRDVALKKLSSFLDVTVHPDQIGNINVDLKGVGPLVSPGGAESFSVERTRADGSGKQDESFDIRFTGSAKPIVTHQISGGRIGALIEVRDKMVTSVMERLDQLAFGLASSVNAIHEQGVTLRGASGIPFFAPMAEQNRAAEFIQLSDEILEDPANIATALQPDSPGDNRVALAISKLQTERFLNDGYATVDEWYNSIVSDVGVASSKNKFSINQQKDIMTQLNKMREQISGVSIDEETANLLQYQHIFDASSKVIQIADEMLKTILSLKKD